MTDQERNQVLKMIQDGKISAEEGLHLIQALDQASDEEEKQPESGPAAQPAASVEVTPSPSQWKSDPSGMDVDPRVTKIKDTVQRLWQIPLWIGIAITVLSAVGMFLVLRGPGLNFWFFFLILPLLLGVLVIALAVGSHKARWLFVDISEKAEEGGRKRIFFGFPLPLRFIVWFFRTFRRWIPMGEMEANMNGVSVDQIIELLEKGLANEPLVVNVDEGDKGDRVKVFLG